MNPMPGIVRCLHSSGSGFVAQDPNAVLSTDWRPVGIVKDPIGLATTVPIIKHLVEILGKHRKDGAKFSRFKQNSGATMITYEEARNLMQKCLADMEEADRQVRESQKDLSPRERKILGLGAAEEVLHLVIADDATVEYDFGWIFYWGGVDDLSTPDLLAGNAPFICERQTGRLLPTGTAHSQDYYIQNYRDTGDPGVELGCNVEIYDRTDANTISAVKVVRKVTGLGLADSKRHIDDFLEKDSIVIGTADAKMADELIEQLSIHGFSARRIPD